MGGCEQFEVYEALCVSGWAAAALEMEETTRN
jgi:hypothetical protein